MPGRESRGSRNAPRARWWPPSPNDLSVLIPTAGGYRTVSAVLAGVVDVTVVVEPSSSGGLFLAPRQQTRRGRLPAPGSGREGRVPSRRPGYGGATTGSPPLPRSRMERGIPREGSAMDAVKTWTVQVDMDEHEDRTRAVARLRTGGDQSLAGTGLARLPADRNVAQIGDELAVACALSELSHLLPDVAARDIERTGGVPAHPMPVTSGKSPHPGRTPASTRRLYSWPAARDTKPGLGSFRYPQLLIGLVRPPRAPRRSASS